MRTILFALILLIIPLCLIAKDQSEQVETIIFLRHGEKPAIEYGQMNCQGLNRAIHLPKVIQEKFGTPNYIFAPNPFARIKKDKGIYYYVRAFATIEPTAIYNGMDVKVEHPFFKPKAIAQDLLDPKYRNSLLVVSWEHLNIPLIARSIVTSLKGDTKIIPDWKNNDYDSLYILKIYWQNTPIKVEFIHGQEALDNQSKTCPDMNAAPQPRKNLQKIIIIPAAEKNQSAQDQLSCKGFNRALFLPEVVRSKYGEIDKFIIPEKGNTSSKMEYVTSLMTIEPTVVNFNKPLFVVGNTVQEAVASLKNNVVASGNILISWPKNEILSLSRAIMLSNGGDPNRIPPRNPNYDDIYEILLDSSHKQPPVFTLSSEHLNGLSDICPYQ